MDPLLWKAPRREEPLETLPLFATPSVAVETSEEAAATARLSCKAAVARILETLHALGDITADELQERFAWDGDFTRARLKHCYDAGWIEKLDGREGRPLVKRTTRDGRRREAAGLHPTHALAVRLTPTGIAEATRH